MIAWLNSGFNLTNLVVFGIVVMGWYSGDVVVVRHDAPKVNNQRGELERTKSHHVLVK